MLPYQAQYIENVREIAKLSDMYAVPRADFDTWYAQERRSAERMLALRQENIDLLNQYLFPALDDLHNASPAEIAALGEFAAALMDWSTNLDCGTYVLIHDSLLSMYRIRQDRNKIIQELYLLGMGLYFQGRVVEGIRDERAEQFTFENEMVFTEGGSYLKYFPEIEDEATKGYIIRSLANVAICVKDAKRKIGISGRMLDILQDPAYRAMAPGLPWDVFLRRTHQQMSANRTVLSRGNLSSRELALVLESCHEVFKPETGTDAPNVRWLWPYYEMEYTCGFVDLSVTMERLEELILSCPYDQYDNSGLYANVQLAIYYSDLMKRNPALFKKRHYTEFLVSAYEKMLRTVLSFPMEKFNDFFLHIIRLVITDYFEMEGLPSYLSVSTQLLRRFSGRLYIRAQKAGDILCCLCARILDHSPDFFDDIPFLAALKDPDEKKAALLKYARQCGLYHDFGLMRMNLERTMLSRGLYEPEFLMKQLHVISGSEELRKRPSTEKFADVAYGHHSWYQGGGYPNDYVRNASPYRQMTDTVAVAAYLLDHNQADPDAVMDAVGAKSGTRFSPLVASFLGDGAVRKEIRRVLSGNEEQYYRDLYEQMNAEAIEDSSCRITK